MQHLECRFYSRQEIAEITSVNLKDSKHFAERVKTTLDKWGYEYNYSRSGVEITGKPELPGEKLSEILIRELNIDVQVDPFAFAYFICAFSDIPHFSSMPWEERSSAMRYKYEVEVSDRTLRNWCSKLIENGIIQKSGEKCFWKTEIMYGMKTRSLVSEDDAQMANYFQKKSEYLKEGREIAAAAGQRGKEASKTAWAYTYSMLWEKFHCCYYSCSGLVFNAIGKDYLWEIYELAQQMGEPPEVNERIIESEEDFYGLWFSV